MFGKEVEFPVKFPALDLKQLCAKLHSREISHVPDSAFDLLYCCLDINPNARISAAEALNHPFLNDDFEQKTESPLSNSPK